MRSVFAGSILPVILLSCFVCVSGVFGQLPGYDGLNQSYSGDYANNQQQASSGYQIQGDPSMQGMVKDGAWQGAPSNMFSLELDYNKDAQSGQYVDYGQSGQYTDYGQSGQFADYGQSGQYGDEISQMSQGDFYEGENRDWLPTFDEFWNLPSEQRREYSKRIKDYIKVLSNNLKNEQKQKDQWYKNRFGQLGEETKSIMRDLSEQSKQLTGQMNAEKSRMKEEERRLLSQLKEDERRVKARRDYMSPVEQAQAIEEIRLRREEAMMAMKESKAQLDEQRLVQQTQLEERKIQVTNDIDSRQQQLQMEEMSAKARYRLAMLSLNSAPYRDRVPRPEFGSSSAVVSERERDFKKRQYDVWKDQRRDEEKRMNEVNSLRRAQTSLWSKVKQRRQRKHAQNESRLAGLRAKAAAGRLKREVNSRKNQLKLQTSSMRGDRRIQDVKLSAYLSELRRSRQRVNSDALRRYKSQISERRKQEDYEIKEATNRLRYEEKEAIASARANDAELKRQLKEQADRARVADRREADRMSAEDKANRDRMKSWTASRRGEERSVKTALDQWLQYQKRAYSQWESSQKAIRPTGSYSSRW